MSTPDLDLASLNLTRRLAEGMTVDQALDQVAIDLANPAHQRDARAQAQTLRRLEEQAAAVLRQG